MPRSYGPVGRTALQVACARRWCTQDSFSAYLSGVLDDRVTRDTVANWSVGREHVPVDVLVHLARHTGQGRDVLQLVAEELGLVVVDRPRGSSHGDEVLVVGSRAAGRVGLLVEHLGGERDEASDGGAARTRAELEERLRLIGDAEQHLAQLRAQTEADLLRSPTVRAVS